MPELPEVESLRRALAPKLIGSTVYKAEFFRKDLRKPIPINAFEKALVGHPIECLARRSKYLIFQSSAGFAIFHLGMTGRFALHEAEAPLLKHTHMRLSLRDREDGKFNLVYIDPRRFGVISAGEGANYEKHPLLSSLGVEPLQTRNLGIFLHSKSRRRLVPIKNFLMNARVVVGIGNIYVSEILFAAKIHPEMPCSAVSLASFQKIEEETKRILSAAIKAGGTTFRDFRDLDGSPGYFQVALEVYGRSHEDCRVCGTKIASIRQAGRSTWFCPSCQTRTCSLPPELPEPPE